MIRHRLIAAAVSGGLFWAASASVAWADKRVALVIGNSAYENVARLPNPARDAAAVTKMFKDAGFDTVINEGDVGNLDFKRAIRRFEDASYDADIAVIFYAGHGIEIAGTNYLIPTDAKLASDRDARDEAISLERLVESVESVGKPKRLRLIILDACRDNPFVKTMKRQRVTQTRAIERGLGAVEPTGSDTLIAYAAKQGSTAEDGEGNHSPFTAALLKSLTVPGLDIRLAFGRVRDEVLKATAMKQEPFVYGSLGGGVVSLVPAPVQAAAAVDTTATKGDYELVAKIGTKKAFQVFVDTYKTGFYVDLARAQIDELSKLDKVASLEPIVSARAPSNEETRSWSRVEKSNDAAALQKFIEAFPNSPLSVNAQNRLDILRREQKERDDKAAAEREAAAQRAEDERRARQAEVERLKAELANTRKRAEEERVAKQAEVARLKAEAAAAAKRAEEERKLKAAAEAERVRTEREAARERAAEERRQREAKSEAERLEAQAAAQRAEEERRAKAAELDRQKREREAALKREEEERRAKKAELDAEIKRAEEERRDRQAALDAQIKRAEDERRAAVAAEAERRKAEQQDAAKKKAEQVAMLARQKEDERALTSQKPGAQAWNTPELVTSAQRHLMRLGCFAGSIDGDLNEATKIAVRRYFLQQKQPVTEVVVTEGLISALDKQGSRVCPLVCGEGQVVSGEVCIAKPNQKNAPDVATKRDSAKDARDAKLEEERRRARERAADREEERRDRARKAEKQQARAKPAPAAKPRAFQEAARSYGGGGRSGGHGGGITGGVGF